MLKSLCRLSLSFFSRNNFDDGRKRWFKANNDDCGSGGGWLVDLTVVAVVVAVVIVVANLIVDAVVAFVVAVLSFRRKKLAELLIIFLDLFQNGQ